MASTLLIWLELAASICLYTYMSNQFGIRQRLTKLTDNNIRLARFFLNKRCRIQLSQNDMNIGMGLLDLLSLLPVSDKDSNAILGMGFLKNMQDVPAYVA